MNYASPSSLYGNLTGVFFLHCDKSSQVCKERIESWVEKQRNFEGDSIETLKSNNSLQNTMSCLCLFCPPSDRHPVVTFFLEVVISNQMDVCFDTSS